MKRKNEKGAIENEAVDVTASENQCGKIPEDIPTTICWGLLALRDILEPDSETVTPKLIDPGEYKSSGILWTFWRGC